MKLEKYRYKGPLSAVTLNHGGRKVEVSLVPGKVVELPPEHDYVRALGELGHLIPVPTEPQAAPAPEVTPKKGGKTDAR